MPSADLPEFPPGLTETHLHRLSLSSLLKHDAETEARLFDICKTQGFFYLNLTETPQGKSLLDAANQLEELSTRAFKVPDSQKRPVGLDKTQSLFGWKANGIVAQNDPYKRTDVGQFWNVSKDDVLGNPGCKGVPYPSPLKEEIGAGGLLEGFMREAHGTGLLILNVLARKLGLGPEDMNERHRLSGLSGDHVRLTYGPGDLDATDVGGTTEANTRITTYGHTDFGSITLLFNWLGGLQIENAQTGNWDWVRPVPGHAIVNLGDAMKEFSGHQLASGKHRVVTAPGQQAKLERYSVVYFVRPEDDVYMDDLTQGANGKQTNGHKNGDGKRWKAGEWILNRARGIGNKIPEKA